MENSFLNVSIHKKMYTVINPLTDKKYTFIKSDAILNNKSTYKEISKEKRSHIKNSAKRYSTEKYNISEIHISDNSIMIGDWLNEDDTIQMVLNKIGIYCGNTIGDHVYAWYKGKPLAFSYKEDINIEELDKNTKPDDNFYRGDIFNSSIYIDKKFNELLGNIVDLDYEFYFITLQDFININKSDELIYFNGIIPGFNGKNPPFDLHYGHIFFFLL